MCRPLASGLSARPGSLTRSAKDRFRSFLKLESLATGEGLVPTGGGEGVFVIAVALGLLEAEEEAQGDWVFLLVAFEHMVLKVVAMFSAELVEVAVKVRNPLAPVVEGAPGHAGGGEAMLDCAVFGVGVEEGEEPGNDGGQNGVALAPLSGHCGTGPTVGEVGAEGVATWGGDGRGGHGRLR